jgi:hypothetical protein
MDINSPLSFLPIWASNMIEATGSDVGDICSSQQTHSQKNHSNVSFMTHVI